MYEAAILIESGYHKMMDKNIVVVANEGLRIERVTKRDQVTRGQVLERMARQWADEQKTVYADKIIYNNNELLIPQVLAVHDYLKVGK